MKFLNIALMLGLTLPTAGYSQDISGLDDLSLEELMDVKVKVASDTDKPLREAPGIITVITEEQIRRSGARDLREILVTVLGITLGQDIQGNISIIMRGIWAQEGRILLLIDGIEMNERSYGSLHLPNHYSAEHIKRVEVIRGPGSAIYGGFAELGVINVITKTGEDLKGMEVSSSYSRTSRDFGSMINNFMFGHKKDDLSLSVKGMQNKSNFSDRDYTDENGTTANLGNGNSKAGSEFLHFQSNYKNLYATYIKDNYRTENIILWGDLENTPGSGLIRKPVSKDFITDAYQIGYRGDVTENLNLNFYYQDKVQHPYFQPEADNDQEFQNSWRRKVQRRVLGVKSKIQLNEAMDLNLGSEYSQDRSWVLNELNYAGNPDVFGDGTRDMQITNMAAFAQFNMNSDFGNFTTGLRYDDPNAYNETLVPRLAWTKVFKQAHIKALYAEAFRAPVIENISLNDSIKPELTSTSEVEVGYLFTKNLAWSLNIFSTEVKDIIVYSYDAGLDEENYSNYPSVKTVGLESEVLYKNANHDIKFNYSTYKVSSLRAPPFKTGFESSALIGAPKHKFYLSDSIRISEKFRLTPSLVHLNGIYGKKWDGAQFSDTKLENQYILNFFANYKDFFFKGFEVGGGINNLLNSTIQFVQPYIKEGDYKAGPYPGQSREYVARIGYSMEY